MTQDLMMSIRVNVNLWKRFERAIDRSHEVPDDVIKALMSDYADRHLLNDVRPFRDIDGDKDVSAQIDLEEFL